MTTFQEMHRACQHLHYEGLSSKGESIVIDSAEIIPGSGSFEVMTMYSSGREIACKTVKGLEEAEKVYRQFYREYVEPRKEEQSKPLTGKYAKLRDDLKKALEAGRTAEAANPDDGGACNFDSVEIHLPRWNAKLIEQAAKEAGTRAFSTTAYGSKIWLFNPKTNGQANARSRNAEAMSKIMQQRGYNASVWYQMD